MCKSRATGLAPTLDNSSHTTKRSQVITDSLAFINWVSKRNERKFWLHFHPFWSFWAVRKIQQEQHPHCLCPGVMQERILFMTLTRLDLVIKMLLFWCKKYFYPQLPLQLSSGFPILKCLFQHSRLNCFSLRVGHRTQGVLSFLTSKGTHRLSTVCFFNSRIKSSTATESLLITSKFLKKGFISTVLHACTYTTEDVWTLITRGWWHHKANSPHCFLRPHNHQRSLVFLWKLQGSSVELLEIIMPTGRVVLIWLNSCFIQGVRTLMSGRTAKTLT